MSGSEPDASETTTPEPKAHAQRRDSDFLLRWVDDNTGGAGNGITLAFYLCVFFMAVLSFVPILALSGSEDIFTIYNHATGMVKGDRARFQDAMVILKDCNTKLHACTTEKAKNELVYDDFEMIKSQSTRIVEQLLESETHIESLQKRSSADRKNLSEMRSKSHDQMRQLNVTYSKLFSDSKKKILRLQNDFQRQANVNEKLESQLYSLGKELKTATQLREDALAALKRNHVKELAEARRPCATSVDGGGAGVASTNTDEVASAAAADSAGTTTTDGEIAETTGALTPAKQLETLGGGADAGCDKRMEEMQGQMQDEIDQLHLKLSQVQQQLQDAEARASKAEAACGEKTGGMHAAVAAVRQPVTADAPCTGKVFEYNSRRPGEAFVSKQLNSARRCKEMCLNSIECRAWTYRKTDGVCELKEQIEEKVASSCCVSGVKCH